jgi:hypothetical protein
MRAALTEPIFGSTKRRSRTRAVLTHGVGRRGSAPARSFPPRAPSSAPLRRNTRRVQKSLLAWGCPVGCEAPRPRQRKCVRVQDSSPMARPGCTSLLARVPRAPCEHGSRSSGEIASATPVQLDFSTEVGLQHRDGGAARERRGRPERRMTACAPGPGRRDGVASDSPQPCEGLSSRLGPPLSTA